jgi:hypothetical protein
MNYFYSPKLFISFTFIVLLVSCGNNNNSEESVKNEGIHLSKSGEWLKVETNNPEDTFWIMKHEATVLTDESSTKKLVLSDMNLAPTTDVTIQEAESYCKSLGEKYSLVTNNQWISIANQIEQNPINWTGQKAYSGCLYQGNNGHETIGTGKTIDSSCGYSTENNSIDYGPERDTRSIHTLTNGSIIYDFAGNVNEWVKNDSITNELFHDCDKGPYEIEDLLLCEIEREFLLMPLGINLTMDSGIGGAILLNSGDVFLRGGHYGLYEYAGIYSIFQADVNLKGNAAGFRCTYK